MSEMVERVAIALFKKTYAERTPWKSDWESLHPDSKINYRNYACVAMETMLVPTMPMKTAGHERIPVDNPTPLDAQHIWTAMMREALK